MVIIFDIIVFIIIVIVIIRFLCVGVMVYDLPHICTYAYSVVMQRFQCERHVYFFLISCIMSFPHL